MATAIRVSDWYTSLACYTFPTVFIPLDQGERQALIEARSGGPEMQAVCRRLGRAMRQLPGSAYVHADACAPTDSPSYQTNAAVRSGRRAWRLLMESRKVRDALADGRSTRLGLHPYRRLDPVREFRLFIRDRELVGMSQRQLQRHFARLAGRRAEIWHKGCVLAREVAPSLPAASLVVDVYLTSAGDLMIISMDPWGEPTSALLFRTWDREWAAADRLRLIPRPTPLGGEVEVSF